MSSNPHNVTSTTLNDDSSSYNQWVSQFKEAEGQWLSDFAQFLKMAKSGDPGEALMFAMTVLLPDKMVLGQVAMERQSMAISELSNLTNLLNQLQSTFQNGNYNGATPAQQAANEQADAQKFTNAYNALQNELNNNPWLSDTTISVDHRTFNMAGILGEHDDTSSTWYQLNAELNNFSAGQSGNNIAPAPTPTSPTNPAYTPGANSTPTNSTDQLVQWQWELANSPQQVQGLVNNLSEMTQQTGSVSQFQNNQLQYQQQDYTQITQAVQDILTNIISMIAMTTTNESSTS
ncbi:MAG: hypothetical protein HY860_06050 [Chlamydiales bacterium]|nr:hypothetical protein [Chlamydiales bacterium]